MLKVPCAVGIMAHNEEANIGHLLEDLLNQRLRSVSLRKIIVVASGCTDRTEDIVRDYEVRDDRIVLLVQPKREGKASAINLFLQQADEHVMVLSSADLRLPPDTLEALVAPFRDPEVGMTASHPVPVNDPQTFMGFTAHLLWELHHQMNLYGFKAGELIAFRRSFERIPQKTAVDEASIEPLVRGQGYKVRYIPEAIVSNKGPESIDDFLKQRRRIYAGHLELQETTGYAVSSMSGAKIAWLLLRNLDWRPRQFLWTWAVVALEIRGRLLGWQDYRRHRDHTVWEIATSTKELEV